MTSAARPAGCAGSMRACPGSTRGSQAATASRTPGRRRPRAAPDRRPARLQRPSAAVGRGQNCPRNGLRMEKCLSRRRLRCSAISATMRRRSTRGWLLRATSAVSMTRRPLDHQRSKDSHPRRREHRAGRSGAGADRTSGRGRRGGHRLPHRLGESRGVRGRLRRPCGSAQSRTRKASPRSPFRASGVSIGALPVNQTGRLTNQLACAG